jgi:hypothetical protein
MVIVLPNPAEARSVAVTASFEDGKVVHVRVAEAITHAQPPEVVITFLTTQEAHVFHGKIAREFLSAYEQYIRDRQLQRPAE